MMDKNKKRIICETIIGKEITLAQFLKKCFPKGLSKRDGKVIWDLLENKDLIVNGHDIAGSFRYNGAEIAEVVEKGTDYMNFYCAWVHDHKKEKKLKKIIEKNGGKIKEMNKQ